MRDILGEEINIGDYVMFRTTSGAKHTLGIITHISDDLYLFNIAKRTTKNRHYKIVLGTSKMSAYNKVQRLAFIKVKDVTQLNKTHIKLFRDRGYYVSDHTGADLEQLNNSAITILENVRTKILKK
jgi:hypothetical protein